jgi:glyoxylase-like metal-dependent hydrolase (beta-lactamase superfamily II)
MADESALDYPIAAIPESGTALEVAPGVRWVRMPLPFALDHINLWLLDDGDSVVVVDTGYGRPEVQQAWKSILETDGRPVSRIVVTHCHPDHLGLAAWLATRYDAPLLMTQGEFLGGHALWGQIPGYTVDDQLGHFRSHGLDAARLDALAQRGNAYRKGVAAIPRSYRRLFAGDILEIGGRRWEAIIGFGHSPEHLSLHCSNDSLLISGDMLLPRISTNVSVYAASPDDDPLGWFLASLHCIKTLPSDTLVLPSHGRPFRGIAPRVDELTEHHRERCAALLAACSHPCSAADLLPELFRRPLDTHQVMFAMGEAIAHLNHLAARDEVRRMVGGDGIVRYEAQLRGVEKNGRTHD